MGVVLAPLVWVRSVCLLAAPFTSRPCGVPPWPPPLLGKLCGVSLPSLPVPPCLSVWCVPSGFGCLDLGLRCVSLSCILGVRWVWCVPCLCLSWLVGLLGLVWLAVFCSWLACVRCACFVCGPPLRPARHAPNVYLFCGCCVVLRPSSPPWCTLAWSRAPLVSLFVLCVLPGFVASGGHGCLAPGVVPWFWLAVCLSRVPLGPAFVRRAASGPSVLGVSVSFSFAVVPSPTGCSAPPVLLSGCAGHVEGG